MGNEAQEGEWTVRKFVIFAGLGVFVCLLRQRAYDLMWESGWVREWMNGWIKIGILFEI